MFGIGSFELFLILLFGFLIFGPDKLPKIANTVGKAIAKFRNAQDDMTEKLKTNAFVDKDSDEPFKNPLDVIENAANEAKTSAEKVQQSAEQATTKIKGHSESFAERKARYDQERAAKKAQAEAEGAKPATDSSSSDPVVDVSPKKVVEEADDSASAGSVASTGSADSAGSVASTNSANPAEGKGE